MPKLPRTALVLGFALGFLIAAAPSCSSSGGGTGGGSGGGTGGSGGSAGNGGTDAATFCNEFANAYCDYAIRCGFAALGGKSDCVSYFRGSSCGPVVQLVNKGYETFDSANGASCVASLKNLTCGGGASLEACGRLFAPNSGTNAGCGTNADCKNYATESCSGAVCGRTCQTAGTAVGQSCYQSGSCNAGLKCDQATRTCTTPGVIGAACSYGSDQCDSTGYCDSLSDKCVALPTSGQTCRSSSPRCTGGFYCGSGTTCQAKLGQGVTCTTFDSCQDALFCNLATTTHTCQPRLAAGVACPAGSGCQTGLLCLNGSCQLPLSAGKPCVGSYDCEAALSCDPILAACTASAYDLTQGQACTGFARYCAYPLRCQGAVVNPSGGVGTLGTCGLPKVGDSCRYRGSSECPNEAFCNLAVDGGAGTCVAAGIGTPCMYSQECKASDFCDSSLCAARKASGTACTFNDACVTPLSCVESPTGTKTCGLLGDLNAACSTTSTNQVCLFPLACTGGTCKHAGAPGEKCLGSAGYGFCLTGSCPLDGGNCESQLVNGSTCSPQSPFQCVSGVCGPTYKCEQSCP